MKQLFDISGCETVTHFALGIKTYTNFCYFLLPLPCDEECNFKFRYRTKLNISQSTLDEFLFSRKDWVQLSLLLLYKKSHVWWSTSGAWSLIYIQLVPCMKDVSVYKKKNTALYRYLRILECLVNLKCFIPVLTMYLIIVQHYCSCMSGPLSCSLRWRCLAF